MYHTRYRLSRTFFRKFFHSSFVRFRRTLTVYHEPFGLSSTFFGFLRNPSGPGRRQALVLVPRPPPRANFYSLPRLAQVVKHFFRRPSGFPPGLALSQCPPRGTLCYYTRPFPHCQLFSSNNFSLFFSSSPPCSPGKTRLRLRQKYGTLYPAFPFISDTISIVSS